MIEVRLPEIRNPGLSVSNWEIMEKRKEKSKAVEASLRQSELCLSLFTPQWEEYQYQWISWLRAYQSDDNYPTQVHWEGYFSDRGVTSFDDGKPGERADTVHIKGLPACWFSSKSSNGKPCTKVCAHIGTKMLIYNSVYHTFPHYY